MNRDTARDVAASVIASETYKDSILRRAAAGTLPPAVEERLWSLAAGASPDERAPRLALVQKDTTGD